MKTFLIEKRKRRGPIAKHAVPEKSRDVNDDRTLKRADHGHQHGEPLDSYKLTMYASYHLVVKYILEDV